MTEEFVERRHCSMHWEEHLRSCINADNIEKIKTDHKENLEAIYANISRKTPLWTFLPIAAIMLSMLALQWEMNKGMSDLQKSMAVLEYKVENKR